MRIFKYHSTFINLRLLRKFQVLFQEKQSYDHLYNFI